MDPGVGAVVYGAELTRLGAIVCGAEVPRLHAEPYRAGADVAQGRRRRSQRRARRRAPATLCFLAPRAPVTICRDARTGESLTRNKLAITSWQYVERSYGAHWISLAFHLIKDCSFLFPIRTEKSCTVIICVCMCFLVDDLNPLTKFL